MTQRRSFPRSLISCCFLTALCLGVYAQEQPGKLQRADDLFERFEYFKSAAVYLELAARKNPPVHVLERLAGCYFYMNNFSEAEKWQEKLAGTTSGNRYAFDYGQVLLINQKFVQAKEQFSRYYGKNSSDLAIKLAQCDSAIAWMNDQRYSVINYASLNSPGSDWGIVDYKGALVFASDRIAPLKDNDRYHWTNNGFLKLYTIDSVKGVGLFDTGGDAAITRDLHHGPIAFSAGGDTSYLTVTTGLPKKTLVAGRGEFSGRPMYTRRLELFTAVKQDGKWTGFKRFPFDNANAWSVGHAALSPDGTVIYFTADLPGGQGKTDIWYCVKQVNGSWGRPMNCGKTINTKEEEAFPTICDGKLYFASKGQPGMGGYDIFETSGTRGSWLAPLNMKYPLNSTYDDFWLFTNGQHNGYFSSNRPGGAGDDDIYYYVGSPRLDKSARKNVEVVLTPPPSSSFPPEKAELIPGKTFVLNTVYYDLDKWNIRPDAAAVLHKLVGVMTDNPTIRIELSSHTDARAPDDYNLRLSEKRAVEAVEYLVSKGILPSRLVARGYGETRLVNRCMNNVACGEQEHQMNRRTEIKVLSN